MIDDRPVWAVVPTIGHSQLLIPLINALGQDRSIDRIILTVNLELNVESVRDVFRFGEPTISILETWAEGKSIHNGWNIAIELARESDTYLAVLNDDIRIFNPNAITYVARLLSENPSYAVIGLNGHETPEGTSPSAPPIRQVHGSYRHHGVWGCAWVCDPHKIETVPDDLVHWGGDDFIFFRAMDAGHKLGIANHVHVEHPHPETTASTQPWTHEARARDKEVFETYYPGRGW